MATTTGCEDWVLRCTGESFSYPSCPLLDELVMMVEKLISSEEMNFLRIRIGQIMEDMENREIAIGSENFGEE